MKIKDKYDSTAINATPPYKYFDIGNVRGFSKNISKSTRAILNLNYKKDSRNFSKRTPNHYAR
jgi:hypothetical protein